MTAIRAARSLDMSVGVVVPVLDAALTVDAAINSVVNEMPAGSPIVVVDGGSTDGTLRRLEAHAGITIVHQVGRGLAAARNQGLAAIATELVAFCDADDRWVPGGLGARLRHLRDHPTCGVVAGAVRTWLIDGEPVPPARSAQLGRVVPGYTPGALLVRRSVFDAIGGFDERLQIASDSGWMARLLQSGERFDLVDEVVLFKGIRSSSLSTDLDTYRHELLTVVRGHLGERRSHGSMLRSSLAPSADG